MEDSIKLNISDDLTEMIERTSDDPAPASQEEIMQALQSMASLEEEEAANDPWIQRCQELPDYKLDVVRDGSDKYNSALTDAILAITGGNYGNINYKGYKIYYTDSPHIRSISVADGHTEYSYEIGFKCDDLMVFSFDEYSSEDERKAFLDPENEAFQETIALLDSVIKNLDAGTWIKERKNSIYMISKTIPRSF